MKQKSTLHTAVQLFLETVVGALGIFGALFAGLTLLMIGGGMYATTGPLSPSPCRTPSGSSFRSCS